MRAELAGARNRLIDLRDSSESTWEALPDRELPSPVAVVVDSSFDALAAVRAHARDRSELLIVAAGRMEPGLRAELRAAGFAILDPDGAVEPPTTPRAPEPGRLWLLTSGSTGRPKRIGHTLESLTTVAGEMAPRTWLCPYSPGTYAWWQVVTLGLGSPGQDLAVVDPADLDGWPAAGVEHGITAASGTPTFWRQAIMGHKETLARVPLEQISLGGEPVDQAVLDQLRGLFPQTRISWLYASSELGASIVVHDGRAGFPVEWLDRDVPGRPRISVREGELVISSPHHGAGQSGEVRTGDAVVVEDGRVLITGRLDSDEINVGGAKVSAGAVRAALTAHPDVAWARVRGRRSPLVGNLVTAEVVLAAGADEAGAVADLKAWCAERLADYAVPRMIKILAEIPATATLKSDL